MPKLPAYRRVLRRREAARRAGISLSTVYRLRRAGQFPQPVRLGCRAVGFLVSDIDAWIDARIAESRE
ncbi:MAG: AlpA family phage regulatory protein [Thermomonas sp.]|nr:AlpA family phage regulatory protein [Thermomonas sp.]